MKKLVIGSFLVLGISYYLVSCSGKVYDADPNKDYTAAGIPDSTKGIVLVGSMQGMLDGAKVTFAPSYYKIITDPDGKFPPYRSIYGSIRNDTQYYRSVEFTVLDSIVANKDTVVLTDLVTVSFKIYDTVLKKQKVYVHKPGNNKFNITLVSGKDKLMKGFMHGSMENVLPEPGNPNDVARLDSLFFHLDENKSK